MDSSVSVLRKRAEFLAAAASGFKFVKPSIVVQARKRAETEFSVSPIRVGFTATKKLGNAVIRNRAKRRMRAAAAELAPRLGLNGCDYVFIGREAAFKGTYDDLIRDMKHALKRLADMMRKTESADTATHEPPCKTSSPS
jgi:ribonuclease P protein component